MTARALELTAHAVAMVRAGSTPAAAAKHWLVHVSTVRRACHRAGVTLRPPGRPRRAVQTPPT
jgi:hypothetical protein